MNLSSIIEESKNIQTPRFIETVDNTLSLLRQKRERTGNLTIYERLVTLEPKGEALVVGDLHGDLESLFYILKKSDFINNLASSKEAILIFLGDYGDRGPNSAEVYYTIMKLKLSFPDQIILLRGNHEGPVDLHFTPHDLPLQFQIRFEEDWKQAYYRIRELFACFYNAVLVKKRFLMVHGGLSPNIKSVEDIALAHLTHPKHDFLEHLLWSDPKDNIETTLYSTRGAGKFFSRSVTINVLEKIGARILIRGHEPCDNGFKFNHGEKVLTLFSRKGYPYFNEYGAYMQLPLYEETVTSKQLFRYIHKF